MKRPKKSIIVLVATLMLLPMASVPLPGEEEFDPLNEERVIARRQRAQLRGFFMKKAGDASLPKTPISVELYNQAVDHYQRQDYELARLALAEAIIYDERNSFAYELLADIDYLDGNLEDARKGYREAFRIRPSGGLREKLEKMDREFHTEQAMSTYETEHFILKYDGALSDEEVTRVSGLLSATYDRLSEAFGHYFRQPVTVLLYSGEHFKEITELPHWITGVYDGKIRMPVYPVGFMEQEIQAIAAHEMTHAIVAQLSGGHAPAWINEGLAEYEEHQIRPEDPIVFRAAVKTNSLLPLEQLLTEEITTGKEDPLFANLFYAQSHHLVQYMVSRYGLFAIKRILAEFAHKKTSEEALYSILKLTPAQLEKEWKESF